MAAKNASAETARKAPILPGGTIGMLGSGQLGRMFVLTARRSGYRVHVFSPDAESPAGQLADAQTVAAYDDRRALEKFAEQVGVVSYEFENIPAASVAVLTARVAVYPSEEVLHITQNREREKEFLAANGFPLAPFRVIGAAEDLRAAGAAIGFPSILKTAGFGYDGKGQQRLDDDAALQRAADTYDGARRVLEGYVDFSMEFSLIVARGIGGEIRTYPAIENRHRNHILDLSVVPAALPAEIAEKAADTARAIAEALDLVGLLCIEFFLARDGRIIVNELAPRPHNSGHLTIEAAACSQFEQQLRAICGLPLGSSEFVTPAAMANLLGDLWSAGTPRWDDALAVDGVRLHLYGKHEARAGRKMGHLTAVAPTRDLAIERVTRARERLRGAA